MPQQIMRMQMYQVLAVLLPGSKVQRRGNFVASQHAEEGDQLTVTFAVCVQHGS